MPRTRSTDSRRYADAVSYTHYSVPSGTYTYTYGKSYATVGEVKTVVDEVHPNFLQRKNNGEVVLGDLDIVTGNRTWTDKTATLGPHPTWGTRISRGDFVGYATGITDPCPELTSFLTQMKSLALTKAYARVDPDVLMTGETVKDFETTILMLRRPFKSSRDLLQRMLKQRKRTLGKTAESAAKATANAWLEYRYGWRPVISDVNNVIGSTHKIRENMTGRRLVARAEESLSRDVTKPFSVAGGIPTWDRIDGNVRSNNSMRACAGVIYDVKHRTTTESLQAFTSTRTSDIPATLWELIPYSFVVDWFVNVGDWLQAVTPNPYVTVQGNWVTTIHDKILTLSSMKIFATVGVITFQDTLNDVVTTTNTVQRRCNQAVTSPVLRVNSLSVTQSADAMSLALNPIMGMLKVMKH